MNIYGISSDDIRVSLRDLAAILQMISVVMLLPLIATVVYPKETTLYGRIYEASAFILPSLILHIMYKLIRRSNVSLPSKTKHIMITVGLAWLIIALVGSLPFTIRGALSPLDSFFESMSGWTTSGFSMIKDFENSDRDLLLYRGIMQGVGGLGVISLGLMVLLQGGRLGVGYVDVGIQTIKPGIRQTIVESWKIYGLYILFGIVALNIAGMNLFDAINHSMAAMATGGFSTHSDIGYYNSFPIELVLMILMFLGMTSFIVHFHVFNGERNALKSEELKYMFIFLGVSILAIGASIWGANIPGVDTHSIFDIARKTSFHVISGMSTCGFNTVDFGKWPEFAKTFMVGLMYVGGMSSSTAGGIRVIRFIILVKAIHYSLKKLVLPKTAIVVMKIDNNVMREGINTVVGYSVVYFLICTLLAMNLMLLGYRSVDSMSTIMSAMGNDGLGVLSGTEWYDMTATGKLSIILAMWIGRIEIYPGLLIFFSLLEKMRLI